MTSKKGRRMKPGKQMPTEDDWPRGSLGEDIESVPDATGYTEPLDSRAQAAQQEGAQQQSKLPLQSWVIWLKDGRYSYAWGETQTDAWASWLKGFGEGVMRIVPAGEYTSGLPIGGYLREMNGQA
jgi:hypothetical protein